MPEDDKDADNLPDSKKDCALTQDEFDKLLSFLDSDREIAGEKYKALHLRLVSFSERRGCSSPEDLADETMSRAARRLDEGVTIYSNDPAAFFRGVARHVLQECRASQARVLALTEDIALAAHLSQSQDEIRERESERLMIEKQVECLEWCMEKLSGEDREIIIEYYQGETSVKIKNRKNLAERLGMTINALRLRAFRIRERLEDCLEHCLDDLQSA